MAEAKQVGDAFRHERTCEKYTPLYYAAASGDFNPVHVDPEVGAAAGYGGTILQGLCTMAWAAEAALGYLGDPAKLKRLKVRFSRPVRPGDVVTFDGKVTRAEGDRLTGAITARNQRGDEVLTEVMFEAKV